MHIPAEWFAPARKMNGGNGPRVFFSHPVEQGYVSWYALVGLPDKDLDPDKDLLSPLPSPTPPHDQPTPLPTIFSHQGDVRTQKGSAPTHRSPHPFAVSSSGSLEHLPYPRRWGGSPPSPPSSQPTSLLRRNVPDPTSIFILGIHCKANVTFTSWTDWCILDCLPRPSPASSAHRGGIWCQHSGVNHRMRAQPLIVTVQMWITVGLLVGKEKCGTLHVVHWIHDAVHEAPFED